MHILHFVIPFIYSIKSIKAWTYGWPSYSQQLHSWPYESPYYTSVDNSLKYITILPGYMQRNGLIHQLFQKMIIDRPKSDYACDRIHAFWNIQEYYVLTRIATGTRKPKSEFTTFDGVINNMDYSDQPQGLDDYFLQYYGARGMRVSSKGNYFMMNVITESPLHYAIENQGFYFSRNFWYIQELQDYLNRDIHTILFVVADHVLAHYLEDFLKLSFNMAGIIPITAALRWDNYFDELFRLTIESVQHGLYANHRQNSLLRGMYITYTGLFLEESRVKVISNKEPHTYLTIIFASQARIPVYFYQLLQDFFGWHWQKIFRELKIETLDKRNVITKLILWSVEYDKPLFWKYKEGDIHDADVVALIKPFSPDLTWYPYQEEIYHLPYLGFVDDYCPKYDPYKVCVIHFLTWKEPETEDALIFKSFESHKATFERNLYINFWSFAQPADLAFFSTRIQKHSLAIREAYPFIQAYTANTAVTNAQNYQYIDNLVKTAPFIFEPLRIEILFIIPAKIRSPQFLALWSRIAIADIYWDLFKSKLPKARILYHVALYDHVKNPKYTGDSKCNLIGQNLVNIEKFEHTIELMTPGQIEYDQAYTELVRCVHQNIFEENAHKFIFVLSEKLPDFNSKDLYDKQLLREEWEENQSSIFLMSGVTSEPLLKDYVANNRHQKLLRLEMVKHIFNFNLMVAHYVLRDIQKATL